jgi:hypothetical protein
MLNEERRIITMCVQREDESEAGDNSYSVKMIYRDEEEGWRVTYTAEQSLRLIARGRWGT